MATNVKLIKHQGLILQSPYVHTETKFHFDVSGYGSGKTSGLVYALLYTISKLQGKKDAEGNHARVILASKNLTFLSKTSISNLEQVLRRTNTDYRYDKKNNIITVGTVDIFLIPLENPETIYGYSCFEENTKIVTEYGELKIKNVKEGMRVWTTKGWKRVKHVFNNGKRDCIKVTVGNKEILCTPEHRFIDYFNNEIQAKDLTKTTSLIKLDIKRWQKWLNTNGKLEKNLKLLTTMISDTTDTLIQNLMEKDVITLVPVKIRRKVTQLCTEIYGDMSIIQKYQKDMIFTIKTETILITILKILNSLQEVNMLKSTGKCRQKRNAYKHYMLLKMLKKEIKNFVKILTTEKFYQKEQKNEQRIINLTVYVMCVGNSLSLMLKRLSIVAKNVKEWLVINLLQREEKHTMRKDNVLSVKKSSCATDITKLHKPAHLTAKTSSVVGQYTVYDIEVEDVHEYFAEGIRVHNCVASFLDELSELPPDVCMEAIKAINERTRQTVKDFRNPFIVSVSSSQGLDGQYMAMEHFKRNGISYVYIRGETKDNIYLKKSDIDNLYKIYNETERKVYLEGYFLSVKTSLVFSDYDPKRNMLAVDLFDQLEPDDTVYIGQDFNSWGCAGVACVVKKGAIIVIKDYDIPDIRRAPEIFRYDFPTQKIVWIPDATATSFYTQFKKELWAKDIKVAYRKSNPLVQDRVFVINKLLYSERMFVCPIAKSVEHSLLTHQFDAKTGHPMKGGKGAPDHISDAMGYAVYHIMCWVKDLKDLYQVTLGRSKISRIGSLGQEVDADYRLLAPEKMKFEVPDNVDNLA